MDDSTFTILIANASPGNQEALRRILAEDPGRASGSALPGYSLCTANSGEEALEKAMKGKPDIILLDTAMPGLSGFDVLARLKAYEDTQQVPVIITSGSDDEEDEEKSFLLGAVDYIRHLSKRSIVLARIKTHLKVVEQMRIIEQLSLADPLTNISNRRNFDNRMELEWKRAVREKTAVSVLMIDVDRFKLFNDSYGHQQGDVALQMVARTVNSEIKRPVDLAARWGGEEFVALLPNTGLAGALHVAERIRLAIEQGKIDNIDGGPSLHVTVSIGAAATIPGADGLPADIIGLADKALYTAKEMGRNRVCPVL